MATAAPPRTHCPTCGAKLHRTDLSLCAYCATPLSIADAPGRVDDETIQRLKRLREHAGFAAAMAFSPLDREAERQRATLLTAGALALLLAVVPALGLAWSALHGDRWIPWAIAAAPLALAGVVLLALRGSSRRAAEKKPMLRRPALVVVRRSETGAESGTTYYFTLRFDDGAEGEFAWPGQGTSYEPLVNGFTGIAYTRGTKLIDFRRLT
jgi:predicted nucleic acid-binding Zn ribbon protein